MLIATTKLRQATPTQLWVETQKWKHPKGKGNLNFNLGPHIIVHSCALLLVSDQSGYLKCPVKWRSLDFVSPSPPPGCPSFTPPLLRSSTRVSPPQTAQTPDFFRSQLAPRLVSPGCDSPMCHKGSKSFQNIAFDSVFVMFPVNHTVIYTFFAITSVQNTCFCSVFNALASKNPAKSCYVQCFFHFWPFFHCRKATKMTQNSISIPSCAQTPKNPRKMSKTPPYSGLGAKPFLGSGLGAKPFLPPPS